MPELPSPVDNASAQPQPVTPDPGWEHYELYQAVKKALFALPSFFKTDLIISGVLATDLFTFNTSLGATIENQVVMALNEIRATWDSSQKYAVYSFVRQSQRFPDVILRTSAVGVEPAIIMGIELKGWYNLAKEKEPSFRYKVTPAVCAPADLLVVYPWSLSNVISGSPRLFQPYVESARYAAEYRNWHWQYKKTGGGNNGISLSNVNHTYPTKSEPISDVPLSDTGGNFGRFARTGLMDEYMENVFREELAGISLLAWQRFLALFGEDKTEATILRALDKLSITLGPDTKQVTSSTIEKIQSRIAEIIELLSQ